jgi:uncharacterized protein (TIGR04255 family)
VSWLLQKSPKETFKRNMLATVVAELKFQPILKLAKEHSEFQDEIRSRFPGYESVQTQKFEFSASGVNVLPDAAAHRFSALNEPIVVALDSTSVSIEYAAHKERKTMLADFENVLKVLSVYKPIPVRLGLRYVNIINQQKVASDLCRSVSWEEMISPAFASVPAGLADFGSSTNYFAQITSPCDRGKMTVMYGLLPTSASKSQHFRLDADRFVEGNFVTKEVVGLLDGFSDDIFQIFKKAAGSALLEWMNAGGIE